MKQTILLSLLSLNVMAQCPVVSPCSNITNLCNVLTNQNYQGNQCFVGFGGIAQSVNWNNWDWLQFISTTASINIQQNVNFGANNSPKYIFCSGYEVDFWGNVTFNGSDTMVVGPNCTVQINNPISNNSTSGQYNTIVLNSNSTLYIGTTEYEIGDTIHTNSSNNSNNIYIIGCNGLPLGNKILQFTLNQNYLSWFVEDSDYIQLQYSENGINFRTIYYTSQNQGNFEIREAGFYRLKSDKDYSKIIQYQIKSPIPENKPYYYMGNFYKQKPQTPYYGTKK